MLEVSPDMTQYEMLDLALSHMSAVTDDVTRAMASISAYLYIAFNAGTRLTRFQASLVSVIFVVFVGQCMHGAASEAIGMASWRCFAWKFGDVEECIKYCMGLWTYWGTYLGFSLMTSACLYFMWSVRHPKAQ